MPSVKVPQKDGELTVRFRGEANTYKVHDHEVTVKQADLERFLTHVQGSSEVTRNPGHAKEGGK